MSRYTSKWLEPKLINKLYRLLGRTFGNPLDLQSYSKCAVTLCPQEEQDVKPSVYLKSHLERVTGFTTNFKEKTPIERMQETHLVHAPTLLFPIGKTRIFGGGLWTAKHEFVTRSLSNKDKFNPINLEKAVIADYDHALAHFGHWLRDVLPASLVGSKTMPALALRTPPYQHAAEYEKFCKTQLIYANQGIVDNLHLLSDYSQNSYKKQRYLTLRTNIEDSLKPAETAFKGVFLGRGQSGAKRTLVNEKELAAHLETRGFDIIHPEKMSVEQIIKRLWGAKMVITVEGSAHNHAVFSMAQTGGLINLQPPNRFGIIIRDACNCLGIRWGCYVCAPANDNEGFYVDSFSNLDKIIDLMEID